MPPRQAPTARQLRLGIEMRKLRERAGLTAREAGALVGTTQAGISNLETGRFGLSEQRIRTLAQHYDCTDEPLIDALVAMAAHRKRGWWEEYREMLPTSELDLAEFEHHATSLRMSSALHIPGLLQTPDYIRALFQGAVPRLSPPDVEHRVSFRIKRQEVLYRNQPTPYTAVIHEAALRMQFGGPAPTREQLKHLIEMSEREEIILRAIPFAHGVFPGSGQPVGYLAGPVPQLDTVQLDQSHGTLLLDATAQREKYAALLDQMESIALNPAASRDFIHRVIAEL